MNYKVEKMYVLPDAGNLKAFADVSMDNIITIKGVRIVRGKLGNCYVSMPQEQGKDNKWYDQVVFTNKYEYCRFTRVVLDHFNRTSVSSSNEYFSNLDEVIHQAQKPITNEPDVWANLL